MSTTTVTPAWILDPEKRGSRWILSVDDEPLSFPTKRDANQAWDAIRECERQGRADLRDAVIAAAR